MRTLNSVFIGALGLLLLASGCSRTKTVRSYGAPIDPTAPKITLAELVSKPEVYSGKNVVMDGQFAGNCGDGDFYFKDKFDIIEADPPDPKVCLLNKGTAVRVYGLVKVRATEANEANEAKEAGKSRNEANEAAERKEGSNEDHAEHTVRLCARGCWRLSRLSWPRPRSPKTPHYCSRRHGSRSRSGVGGAGVFCCGCHRVLHAGG